MMSCVKITHEIDGSFKKLPINVASSAMIMQDITRKLFKNSAYKKFRVRAVYTADISEVALRNTVERERAFDSTFSTSVSSFFLR